VRAIERLRLKERLGRHRIGWALGLAASTVYAVLRRLGISRLRRLEPRHEVIRYEWPAPGDLLHLDTKKLGRFSGVGKRFGGPKRSRRSGGTLSTSRSTITPGSPTPSSSPTSTVRRPPPSSPVRSTFSGPTGSRCEG
jgi:hypothetical protein